MIALNRTHGRAASEGGMFAAAEVEFAAEFDPDAQAILARVGASICPFSTIDIADHALRVTAVALDAKRHPKTRFARPTL